jgi:hypothetical protein
VRTSIIVPLFSLIKSSTICIGVIILFVWVNNFEKFDYCSVGVGSCLTCSFLNKLKARLPINAPYNVEL